MKSLILFITLICSSFLCMCQSSKDTITWTPSTILKKENFKNPQGRPNGLSYSYLGIKMTPVEKEGGYLYNIEAMFLQSKSFMKDTANFRLKHERLHFDICEFYARKLRKEVAERDLSGIMDPGEIIKPIYNRITQEMFQEQDRYDRETKNGIQAIQQKIWNEDVKKRLKEFEKYEPVSVKLIQ